MVTSSDQGRSEKRRVAFGLLAIFVTQFVSFLFINARNIAQPEMVAELDGLALFSWLIALPALSGSISTLLFGKLSDMYGRRKILLISMAIFMLGLGLASTSRSMTFLIASQTFMSIGHWPIIPLCMSAIGDLFDSEERAKWTGLLNLATGLAVAIGPILGGVMSESAGGMAQPVLGNNPAPSDCRRSGGCGVSKNDTDPQGKGGYLGTAAMAVATSTLMIGFSLLGVESKLGSSMILLVVSITFWIIFIQIEKKTEAPILGSTSTASTAHS